MLLQLPPKILNLVLDYCPPQSLINLALTCFQLYHPCQKHLYKEVLVIPSTKILPHANRKHEYYSKSMIYGLLNCTDKDKNLKMVRARLIALNTSIEINPELSFQMKKISIFGDYDPPLVEQLNQLLQTVSCKVYVQSKKLRRQLKAQYNKIAVEKPEDFGGSDELEIWCGGGFELATARHFTVKNPKIYNYLKENNIEIYPESINLDRHTDFSVLNLKKLKNVELTIETPEDLPLLAANLPLNQLQKIVFVQPNVYEHNVNEALDLQIIAWFAANVKRFNKLTYICVDYNPPLDGDIRDDFEGNYLKRIEVLIAFVKVINQMPTPKINLVFPNYLSMISCYDQQMSNVMWNGCKCPYCEVYLEKIDNFVNYHKYFDSKQEYWKDLNNVIAFNSFGQYFNKRYTNCNNWDYLGPVKYEHWDFHHNKFSPIQFQCFNLQTVYDNEYNDEKDVFFDANSKSQPCEYTQLFPFVNICIIHFLQDIVNQLVSLNRGNAESFEIQDSDLNDGDEQINLQNLYLNGFQFAFDKELNGTNFYQSYYD